MIKGPSINLAGRKVGLLTVKKWIGQDENNRNYIWLCDCDCGNSTEVRGQYLVSKKTISCGCLQGNVQHREKPEVPTITYLSTIHNRIQQVCQNLNAPRYRDYGAIGIKMHTPWIDDVYKFIHDILAEIGEKPTSKHSLSRINNEGNFEPGNLIWSIKSGGHRQRNIKGYSYDKNNKRYVVNISVEGKMKHFGSYKTADEAKERSIAVYKRLKEEGK